MKKTFLFLVLGVMALLLVYPAYIALGALARGYDWREMDWNSDGRTTLSEFLSSADIAKRSIKRGQDVCWEYYALKDGLPVRTDCGLRVFIRP
ncbi:hypothetical protein ASD79_17445 [Caulobacter sp. Root655]|nr:hypothetical protein ASD79_17445 [Caulobacter sp. Root655]